MQSGGLLAIGNQTISGPGAISSGTETIIHTPNPDAGGTTALNINAPIFTTLGLT